jgi:hypothetical protein
MPKAKKQTETDPEAPDVFDQAIADRQAAETHQVVRDVAESTNPPEHGHAAAAGLKKPFVQHFGSWRDNAAGVRLEEDRKNNLTTILFRDKPPAKAQQLLEANGYTKDGDNGYSKKIDRLRQYEHRAAREDVVLEVANIVRAEKGLPTLESFYISRS